MLRVLPEKNKIVVEGVNRVYKHLKPSAEEPAGRAGSPRRCRSTPRTSCSTAPPAAAASASATGSPTTGQKERYCKVYRRVPRRRRPGQAGPRQGRQGLTADVGLSMPTISTRTRPARPPSRAPPERAEKDDRTMARLLDQYNTTIAPELADEVQPDEQDGDPEAGQDRHQHGRRPGHPGQGDPGGGRRQPGQDHRPEAADHQGQDLGRRLPAPRGERDRLQGHAPRQADVRVPRPPDLDRPAPYPRLPRA